MAKILEMPKLSPTMEEGVLSAWHKSEGDSVDVDDLLAEVETDKATMEFRAFDRGVLLKRLVAAGTEVRLGQPVAILGEAGESTDALEAEAKKASEGGSRAGAGAEAPSTTLPPGQGAMEPAADVPETMGRSAQRQTDPAHALTRTEHLPDATHQPTAVGGRVLASPHVRQVARSKGVDIARVSGSGPGGRVTLGDLDRAPAAPDPGATLVRQPATGLALREPEAIPLSMMRKTIARRLTESKQSVPHFYLTIDVDAGPISELRESINAELRDAHGNADTLPPKISVNDLLIKACAAALERVPECNAQFAGDVILRHSRIDISVAVAVPDGLVTPVIRDANQKSVVAIARDVRELAQKARSKKLGLEEMTNGTFSISNLGMFGVDEFSAVINPPEGAILAVGRVRDEPTVVDGRVQAGKRLRMTLSCDHRVIDGAVGAEFLAELRTLIERPMRVVVG